jgi:WD40 repeat protein/tetratricopeptide (TPR) repeat protein
VRFNPDGSYVAHATWSNMVSAFVLDGLPTESNAPTFKVDGPPRYLAFDASGSLLAVSTAQNQSNVITIFEAQSGQVKRQIYALEKGNGQSFAFQAPIALNAAGTHLAATGPDHAVQLFDLSDENQPILLGRHRDVIQALCFNPDGTLLASGSHDYTAKLWDVAGKQDPIILAGHTNWVRGVTFSPDGAVVATASDDLTVRLWDASTGQSLMVLQPGLAQMRCVAFSPDGALLAVGGLAGNRGLVYVYQLGRRKEKREIGGRTRAISAIAFHPTKPLIATGGLDQRVQFWDVQTGKQQPLQWRETRNNPISSVTFSPIGDLFAFGLGTFSTNSGSDFSVDLRDVQTGALRWRLTGPTGPVSYVHFSGSGQKVLARTRDGAVFVWNTQTGVRTHEWEKGIALFLDAAGEMLLKSGADGTVGTYDLVRNITIKELKLGTKLNVFVARWDRQGVWVVGDDGTLWVLSIPDLQTVEKKEKVLGRGIIHCAISSDRRLLATYANDYKVVVWNARSLERICVLPQLAHIRGLAFDDDGLNLAIWGQEGVATLWNFALVQPALAALGLDWEQQATDTAKRTSMLAEIEPPPALKNVVVELRPVTSKGKATVQSTLEDLVKQRKFQEAIVASNKAIADKPKDKALYFPLWEAHIALAQYEEATAAAKEHLKLCPNCDKAIDRLVLCSMATGDWESAEVILRRTLAANPEGRMILNDLAYFYVIAPDKHRNPESALPLTQRLIALEGANASNLRILGMVYFRLGKYGQAVEELETSFRYKHKSQASEIDANFFLAMSYHRLGETGKAEKCYQEANKILSNAQFYPFREPVYASMRAETERVLAEGKE